MYNRENSEPQRTLKYLQMNHNNLQNIVTLKDLISGVYTEAQHISCWEFTSNTETLNNSRIAETLKSLQISMKYEKNHSSAISSTSCDP